MERTPSPPRRVHTPPAPGTSYEPFSPRRSSRVAAQRDTHVHHERPMPRTRRDVTPTASSKRSIVRAANFALSPPSSPVSPQHHTRSPRSVRRTHLEPLDSDSDHAAPTPARRFLSAMPSDMLPTPAKTPRKRPIGDLSSTSRILFPQRPATIEEVVPTPRKSRKTKNLFTLESFSAHMDDESEKIPIFTDSKERIPTPGAVDENPFLTTKKGKGRARTTPQKSRKIDQRTAKLNEAAERDEGMVYIFRGKKILRRFHDGPSDNDSAPEDDQELSADEMAIRRQVGREAHRPLTRSSVKPKLLFQKEIQQRKIANGEEEDDEEAVTDIEVPFAATPSRKKGKAVVPQPTLETTPPPTVRKLRKEISFDSWSRVKSSSSSSQPSKKRGGDLLERETGDKRARTRS
ncbi:hypothetical protein T440DRAFT_466977 [Plenodomus tracheiphilus IPT5]|uniref:Uncharacterized protein n=1 Tax=Plenodomus tracheiphilus IPT5 TaxID=1408161 RepID=A0A6A7BA32_9PLEO|nr:hypothetical protein T440DRAFT_466977 [Plenodomus tracheiphilus IPT5]